MSTRFVIDPLDFVRNASTHHAKIAVGELLRLQDYLYESIGTLSYQISGIYDARNKPNLHIKVEGEIVLCCQRCLDKLHHTLDLQTVVLLAKNEFELDKVDKDDAIDAILATSNLDVLDLIEDEIILSLSIASRHLDGECEILKPEEAQENINENNDNPFYALKKLKKTH